MKSPILIDNTGLGFPAETITAFENSLYAEYMILRMSYVEADTNLLLEYQDPESHTRIRCEVTYRIDAPPIDEYIVKIIQLMVKAVEEEILLRPIPISIKVDISNV